MLNEEQTEKADYFGDLSNKITAKSNRKMWENNIRANRKYFLRHDVLNPQFHLKGLAGFLVCAGPSLDKNILELKKISRRGVIVAIDASLRRLIKEGIKPEYCVSIDGNNNAIPKMVKGVKTDGITLVCTTATAPKLIKKWKGDIFFFNTGSPNPYDPEKLQAMTRIVKTKRDVSKNRILEFPRDYKIVFGGVQAHVTCGGNVSTTAHSFMIQYLRCNRVILVGNDLSWTSESHFYAGNEHQENAAKRISTQSKFVHEDINGQEVWTNFSLLSFKRFHESMGFQIPEHLVNATEGGIVGIGRGSARDSYKKETYIEFLTLKEAVAKYASR